MLAVRLSHFDQSRLGRLLDSPPRVFRFDAVILRRLRRASKAEGSLSENARFTPLKPYALYRDRMIFIFSKSKVIA